tara:strand:+ start:227 stop:397 length:171 start_codon:yes stop_codon:yes gene_type:complete
LSLKKKISALMKIVSRKLNNTMKKHLMRMRMKKKTLIQMTRIVRKKAQNPSEWMMR